MLEISGLTVAVDGRRILDGLDLHVGAGEVHVIMGPNGAGKSTLSAVLAGREGYEVHGRVAFDGVDLLALAPEERAAAGLFLAFQHPVEISGVGNGYFLRTALNAVREARGEPPVEARSFLTEVREQMADLQMDDGMIQRAVNDGFSGGEKKRNELLQMAVLQPRLAVLDEIDSGLDIDGLRAVAVAVDRLRSADRSFLIITHNPRLLEQVRPDVVHVLREGRISSTGGLELVADLEREGYGTSAVTTSPVRS